MRPRSRLAGLAAVVCATAVVGLITVLDVDGDGSIDPVTDGALILRYLFGFSGDPLINDIDLTGCSNCMPTEIEAYLGLLDR